MFGRVKHSVRIAGRTQTEKGGIGGHASHHAENANAYPHVYTLMTVAEMG